MRANFFTTVPGGVASGKRWASKQISGFSNRESVEISTGEELGKPLPPAPPKTKNTEKNNKTEISAAITFPLMHKKGNK